MFVIDSDALIIAFRHDFPPQKDPGDFWDWMDDMGRQGNIIIPEAVFDEIKRGTDNLYSWLTSKPNISKEPKTNALPHLARVMEAYGNLTENDVEVIGRKADPYLIAHAIDLKATVVTNETSRPSAIYPTNKKVPDICSALSVSCIRYPRFLWEMRSRKQ